MISRAIQDQICDEEKKSLLNSNHGINAASQISDVFLTE